jgi:hypothetical protein
VEKKIKFCSQKTLRLGRPAAKRRLQARNHLSLEKKLAFGKIKSLLKILKQITRGSVRGEKPVRLAAGSRGWQREKRAAAAGSVPGRRACVGNEGWLISPTRHITRKEDFT